jgi:hypothetical protein
MSPGAHHRLAPGDPFETARDHRLGGQPAVLDPAHDLGRRQSVGFDIGHGAVI